MDDVIKVSRELWDSSFGSGRCLAMASLSLPLCLSISLFFSLSVRLSLSLSQCLCIHSLFVSLYLWRWGHLISDFSSQHHTRYCASTFLQDSVMSNFSVCVSA